MRFSNFLIVCAMVLPMGAWAETLKLVMLEYPPCEYTENRSAKVLAVEGVHAALKLMDPEVVIESYPWAWSERMFEQGEADGVFIYFKNPRREEYALFGKEPVVTQTISLWVLRDSMIEFNGDLDKLRPYSFGVVNTVSCGERFDAAVAHSTESCTSKLLAGEPL